MSDDNVINFPRLPAQLRTPDAPVTPPPFTIRRAFVLNSCRHSPQVDPDARVLECSRFGVALDPFDVLITLAAHHEWYDHLAGERARLESEVEALKGEVSSLRATRNRLKRGA